MEKEIDSEGRRSRASSAHEALGLVPEEEEETQEETEKERDQDESIENDEVDLCFLLK